MLRFPLIFIVFAAPLIASAHPDHRFNAHLVDHRQQARHVDDCDDDVRTGARGSHAKAKARGPRQVIVDRRAMSRQLAELDARIADLRGVLDAVESRRVRRTLHRQIRRLDQQVDRLREDLAEARRYRRPAPVRPARRAPKPMNKKDFRRLERQLARAPFRDDKLRVVRSAARHAHFTSAQARTIARGLPFSSDRVTALKLLHPRVVDPENFEQVFAALPHRSHRRALESAVYASR